MTSFPVGTRFARVGRDEGDEPIAWLSLSKEDSSGGWLLMGHRDRGEACEWDLWFATIEEAMRIAALEWGTSESDWETGE